MSALPSSLKGRIQKLLALANDGRGNEHEAQSAMAKVQALLAEYNLEMASVVDTDEDAAPAGTSAHSTPATANTWRL